MKAELAKKFMTSAGENDLIKVISRHGDTDISKDGDRYTLATGTATVVFDDCIPESEFILTLTLEGNVVGYLTTFDLLNIAIVKDGMLRRIKRELRQSIEGDRRQGCDRQPYNEYDDPWDNSKEYE